MENINIIKTIENMFLAKSVEKVMKLLLDKNKALPVREIAKLVGIDRSYTSTVYE